MLPDYSSSLLFSNFTLMFLGILIFVFIMPKFCWASWICNFMSRRMLAFLKYLVILGFVITCVFEIQLLKIAYGGGYVWFTLSLRGGIRSVVTTEYLSSMEVWGRVWGRVRRRVWPGVELEELVARSLSLRVSWLFQVSPATEHCTLFYLETDTDASVAIVKWGMRKLQWAHCSCCDTPISFFVV